jgi:hypothetical protein
MERHKRKLAIPAIIALTLFYCHTDPVNNQSIPIITISNESILGNWTAQYPGISCNTDSTGSTCDTLPYESTYDIWQDSIKICRYMPVLTKSLPLGPCDLPVHGLKETFWKLTNDSLYVYDEFDKGGGVYDTTLVDILFLIPYSSNQIIFKASSFSDTCRKQ